MILSITSTTPRNLPRQGLLLLCHGSGEINAGNSRHFLFVLMSRGLFFFRWDVSVICIIAILEITVTLFISLCFWPNRLEFFRSKISVCDRKKNQPGKELNVDNRNYLKARSPPSVAQTFSRTDRSMNFHVTVDWVHNISNTLHFPFYLLLERMKMKFFSIFTKPASEQTMCWQFVAQTTWDLFVKKSTFNSVSHARVTV